MRRASTILIIGMIMLMCAGCTLYTHSIHRGMGRDMVYSTLGAPDSDSKYASCWVDRQKNDWTWDKGTYCVSFDNDDRVESYGWEMLYIQRHDANFNYTFGDMRFTSNSQVNGDLTFTHKYR